MVQLCNKLQISSNDLCHGLPASNLPRTPMLCVFSIGIDEVGIVV